MMRVTITIDCDNAVFTESQPEYELSRILSELSEKLLNGEPVSKRVADINGNTVGSFVVSDDLLG